MPSIAIFPISPTNSCPIVKGKGIVFWDQESQLYMWTSVPQMQVLCIFTKTLLRPISGTGTISIHNPLLTTIPSKLSPHRNFAVAPFHYQIAQSYLTQSHGHY